MTHEKTRDLDGGRASRRVYFSSTVRGPTIGFRAQRGRLVRRGLKVRLEDVPLVRLEPVRLEPVRLEPVRLEPVPRGRRALPGPRGPARRVRLRRLQGPTKGSLAQLVEWMLSVRPAVPPEQPVAQRVLQAQAQRRHDDRGGRVEAASGRREEGRASRLRARVEARCHPLRPATSRCRGRLAQPQGRSKRLRALAA